MFGGRLEKYWVKYLLQACHVFNHLHLHLFSLEIPRKATPHHFVHLSLLTQLATVTVCSSQSKMTSHTARLSAEAIQPRPPSTAAPPRP